MTAADCSGVVVWYPKIAVKSEAEQGELVSCGSPRLTRERALADAESIAAQLGDAVVWISAQRRLLTEQILRPITIPILCYV